jgi:hypothetical protein
MVLSPDNNLKLLLVKLLHTLIWIFYASIIFYIVYAGTFGIRNTFVWIAIGLVILEGAVLLFNRGRCPLTPLAARYTDNSNDNFDIFLPNWLARHNKLIFTVIFIIGFLLNLYRRMME